MRHTRSQTAQRRSHHAIKARSVSLCKECGHMRLPHTVCVNCGFYKDRKAVVVKVPKVEEKKKEAKTK